MACGIFSCGIWDLVPWPGIGPRPLALGTCSRWTTREVPDVFYFEGRKRIFAGSSGLLEHIVRHGVHTESENSQILESVQSVQQMGLWNSAMIFVWPRSPDCHPLRHRDMCCLCKITCPQWRLVNTLALMKPKQRNIVHLDVIATQGSEKKTKSRKIFFSLWVLQIFQKVCINSPF